MIAILESNEYDVSRYLLCLRYVCVCVCVCVCTTVCMAKLKFPAHVCTACSGG